MKDLPASLGGIQSEQRKTIEPVMAKAKDRFEKSPDSAALLLGVWLPGWHHIQSTCLEQIEVSSVLNASIACGTLYLFLDVRSQTINE